MSQISPPIRILLVAVIGLCAAYFLFLRPSPEETAVAPPPATTPVPAKDPGAQTNSKPGSAVNQAVTGADNASARADAAAGDAVAETEGGATASPATGVNTNPVAQAPATGETAAPVAVDKAALKRLPKDVRGAVRNRKVIVMLFYNNRSYDDRAVRRELRQVDRFGGQVFVDAHWIKSIGRYQAITRGVNVDQSPTIVVADRNLKAETLVGYVDSATIDQAVVDAIRASGGSLVKDPYFRQLDSICVSSEQQVKALTKPASAAAVPAFLAAAHAISVDADTKVAKVKPPRKRVGYHRAFKAYGASTTAVLAQAMNRAKANPGRSVAVVRRMEARGKRMERRFVARHGKRGLSCF